MWCGQGLVGSGPVESGDRCAGSRSGREAKIGQTGLALRQIWARRGDAAVSPPVERRELYEGEEGQQSGR